MTFAPWTQARRSAYVFISGGVISTAAACIALFEGFRAWWLFAGLGFGFLLWGYNLLANAKSRAFGKSMEQEAIAKALPELTRAGLTVAPNHPIAYGDIDILATGKSSAVAIEIKSFIHWRQFYFLAGARERKALKQVQHQCSCAKATQGVVWLPQGRPNLVQRLLPGVCSRERITVVFGDERALTNVVRRFVE